MILRSRPTTSARAVTDKTKLLVVANPNNPTGALIKREELRKIAELAVERDLLVISDDIYDKIIFDGGEHCSLAAFDGMYERTVTINGFSKGLCHDGVAGGLPRRAQSGSWSPQSKSSTRSASARLPLCRRVLSRHCGTERRT